MRLHEKGQQGHNRLSASVHIWTYYPGVRYDKLKTFVIIAFRLQSIFGQRSRINAKVAARHLVIIAFRLQSIFGRKHYC